MKRITLILAAAALLIAGCKKDGPVEVLFFEALGAQEVPEGWTLIDADGDGLNWRATGDEFAWEGYHGVNGCLLSLSFYWEALTPDNWAVTPAIELPTDCEYQLSWQVRPQDNEYPAEHYSVYVGTLADGQFQPLQEIFAETLQSVPFSDNGTPEWSARTVSLAAYAGQTLHIAFRHHDCTDNYAVLIDDVAVRL